MSYSPGRCARSKSGAHMATISAAAAAQIARCLQGHMSRKASVIRETVRKQSSGLKNGFGTFDSVTKFGQVSGLRRDGLRGRPRRLLRPPCARALLFLRCRGSVLCPGPARRRCANGWRHHRHRHSRTNRLIPTWQVDTFSALFRLSGRMLSAAATRSRPQPRTMRGLPSGPCTRQCFTDRSQGASCHARAA
jgi:hypothetical protein